MSTNLLTSECSIHVTFGRRDWYGDMLAKTSSVPMSMVMALDEFGAALEAKQHNANTLAVGRTEKRRQDPVDPSIMINPAGMDIWVESGVTPQDAAQRYYDAYVGIWRLNSHIDVWITFNEWAAHRAWQSEFYITLMTISIRNGDPWKYAIFSESSGNPPDFTTPDGVARRALRFVRNALLRRDNNWAVMEMLPALIEAKRLDQYLALHEYGEGIDGSFPFHTGRYKALYAILREHNADCKLLITESGFVSYPGHETFLGRLQFLDAIYSLDATRIVHGSALFTAGDWNEADLSPEALQILAEHVLTWRGDPRPDPDPVPEDKIRRVVNVLPQDTTIEQAIEVLEKVFAARNTILFSLHDARDVVHLGNLSSYVTVWGDPSHWQNEGGHEGVENFLEWDDVRFVNFPDDTDPIPPPQGELELIWPTDAEPHFITWSFGDHGVDGSHFGLDTRCGRGTVVRAVADGVVSFIGIDPHPTGGFGLYIRMETTADKEYKIYHGHLLEATVQVGATLRQGDPIALSDNTGNSSGDHHHLEVREKQGVNFVPVDPMLFMREDEKPIDPDPPPIHVPLMLLHLDARGVQEPFILERNVAYTEDVTQVLLSGVHGIKWTDNSSILAIHALEGHTGIERKNMILRLHSAGDNPGLPNPDQFFSEHRQQIDTATRAPGDPLWLEIGNEPNYPPEWPVPLDPATFAAWFGRVCQLIRADHGSRARIIFPGLKPDPNTRRWYETCSPVIMQYADAVGVHCYFQHYGTVAFGILNDSADQAGGLYWQRVAEWIPKDHPMMITEFADNGTEPDLDRAKRTAMYFAMETPIWLLGKVAYISQDDNWPLQAWKNNPHMLAEIAKVTA